MFNKLLVISALFMSFQSFAAEKWKVTSLDWQPFSGKNLPEGGAGIVVLREALKAEGIELEVEFYPWTRAISTAKEPAYAGVYPSWPEDVSEGFVKSSVLFKSPVGFVEPKDKPLVWEKLSDLKAKKIGVVQDYGNTAEFNDLVKSGVIKAEVAADDITNIKKVAGGRLDGAFIDLNNLEYFLKNDAKDIAGKIQANSKKIDTKDLVLGINVKFQNKNAEEILKKGISKINPEKIIQDYMKKYMK